MADIFQVERQLYILSRLSESRRGFTIEEILNSLHKMGVDISRKTMYMRKREMARPYTWLKNTASSMSLFRFQNYSLFIAREVLNSYRYLDVGATAAKIIERIMASMPQINKIYLDTLNNLLKVNVTEINPEGE